MVSVFLSYKSKSSHSNFVLLVPDFIISVYCNSYNYLFLSHSLFFSTSISWPPSCNALGMPLHRNIEREQRSENEAEKDIITWTAVHRYCKIRDYLVKAYIIHIFHFIKFVSARLDDEGKIWTGNLQTLKTCLVAQLLIWRINLFVSVSSSSAQMGFLALSVGWE